MDKLTEENWWEELPEAVKRGIKESIVQADNGELLSLDEVKKEVSEVLKM